MTPRPSGVRSVLSSSAGMLVSLLVFLTLTPFLIARLGTAQFGVLALLSSAQAIVASVDLGLVAGGVLMLGRSLSTQALAEAEELYRELLSVFCFLGTAGALLVLVLAPEIAALLRLGEALPEGEAALLVRIAALSIAVGFMTTAASIVPRALEQFPFLAKVQMATLVGNAAGVVLLILGGYGLRALMLWGLFLSCLVLALYLSRNRSAVRLASMRPVLRFSRLASVAAFSRNVFLTQLSATLTYQADKLIVAALLGPSAVTYYAVATSIGAQLVGASAAVSAFVFPRIAMLHAGRQREQIQALYVAASRYLLLATGPLFISAILLVPELFLLWLGPEARQEAAVPAQLLLLAYFITVFSIIPCQVYNGMGETRLSLGYVLIGTVTNIALCFALIPRLGLAGAGIASVAGMLPSIFLMVSVEKLLKLPWLREQAPFYLRLGLVMALQVTLVAALSGYVQGWLSLVLVAGAGTLLSFGLWFATPLASEQDRTLARRLLQAMRVPFPG